MSVTANRVIDAAALLEDGETIALPCPTHNAMESLRTQLYKVKQRLEKQNPILGRSLYISRKVGDNKWTVFVTKEVGIPGAFILNQDGEARPFDLQVEQEETGEERIERLQAEDELLKIETEEIKDTFDEAAAKIEEAQGLLAEPEIEE